MELSRIIELTAVGTIFISGVICNCIVLRSMSLARSMRGAVPTKNECVNLLIINLAVADLLMLLVSIPFEVVPDHISWPYGKLACKIFPPMQDVCLTTSALTFTAIAVERYLVSTGVVHRGARNAKLIIAGIWLISWLTMGLPMAIYRGLITDENRLECDVTWPSESVAKLFTLYMIALIGACGLTGALAYCGIRRSLAKVQQLYLKQRSKEEIDTLSDDTLVEQVLKVSNLICVLITVFVICVFPFPLFVLLLESDVLADFKYNYVLYLGTSCLLYGNCLANPLILMFMSKDARTALIEKRTSSRRINNTNNIGLENV